MDRTRMVVVVGVMVLALSGCDDKKSEEDTSTADTAVEDTAVDETTDTSPDPVLDTEPEIVPDTVEDTAGDTASDAEPDSTGDAPEDMYGDWPTDLPSDWTTETASECAAAGGFCTSARWVICPIGYEPIDPNPNRDCGDIGMGGWCCVVATPSPCSASGSGNCIVGDTCEGCWDAVALDCETGRVCCQDICD